MMHPPAGFRPEMDGRKGSGIEMRWHPPVDPECPEVSRFMETLVEDPMTAAYGAPVDEIAEAFERKHRRVCARCRDYGAANIEVR